MPSVLKTYAIELPLTVRHRIKSVGYLYKDLSLRLNQSAIMSLLMGEKLYSHPGVALRELIQNALDACDVRRRLEESKTYTPSIEVTSFVDHLGRTWIEVSDNEIGMDEHVLSEFFLKLGDSYYHSSEFQCNVIKLHKSQQTFHPISQFRIGILSVFMLADVLEVRTRCVFSLRGDDTARFIRI